MYVKLNDVFSAEVLFLGLHDRQINRRNLQASVQEQI